VAAMTGGEQAARVVEVLVRERHKLEPRHGT
jgi:hypothetical protein